MMLRTVEVPGPETLAIPASELDLLDIPANRQMAALLLYGIEQGWVQDDEADRALSDVSVRDAALGRIAKGLAEATERAARRVAEGIVPEGQGFTLLEIGLADDERFHRLPDTPCLRVELHTPYHEEIALASLPHALGVAVCVALQLLQAMFPVLVGDDIRQFVWFEEELADEARMLAQAVDLTTLTGEALEALVESSGNDYLAIQEQLSMSGDAEGVLVRLRELSVPPPVAKVEAERYRPVSTETKASLLLEWLEAWRAQGPSLADHPLARWVERVAQVVSRQVSEGRTDRARLEQPDDGDFLFPEIGIVVGFGEEWEDESIEYLFERLNNGDEAPLSLLALDPLALSSTHATLLSLAEGNALLECLTFLSN